MIKLIWSLWKKIRYCFIYKFFDLTWWLSSNSPYVSPVFPLEKKSGAFELSCKYKEIMRSIKHFLLFAKSWINLGRSGKHSKNFLLRLRVRNVSNVENDARKYLITQYFSNSKVAQNVCDGMIIRSSKNFLKIEIYCYKKNTFRFFFGSVTNLPFAHF